MKNEYIFFILLVAVISAAALAWSVPLGTAEQVVPVILNVTGISSRELGFAVSQEEEKELDFGTTFPGTTVIRTLNISKGSEPPAIVSISAEGPLASWLELSEKEFLLKNPKQVKVSVVVPADAHEGRYAGQLKIIYKKTLFTVLST